jgi:hypothetical protein
VLAGELVLGVEPFEETGSNQSSWSNNEALEETAEVEDEEDVGEGVEVGGGESEAKTGFVAVAATAAVDFCCC